MEDVLKVREVKDKRIEIEIVKLTRLLQVFKKYDTRKFNPVTKNWSFSQDEEVSLQFNS